MKPPRTRSYSATAAGRIHRQAGFTLMEAMISLALSLVVTSAMVALMANSLGTTSRMIQMSQLTDQLRNTMSMLTRDIRRANYSANSAYCYANSACGDAGGAAVQFADIDVSDGSCVIFGLDRNFDGDASTDDAGGFRRVVSGGVGRIEMWVGDSDPDCQANNNANWIAITDPEFVNITTFTTDDDDSFSSSVTGEAGSTITQRSRQITIQIEGNLISDNTITRRIEDVIKSRNDMITST
jgi:Tfp pilus assembly protein PilV